MPVQIGSDSDWAQAAAGEVHSLAAKADGTLWTWGANFFGQLGTGTTDPRSTPGPIVLAGGTAGVVLSNLNPTYDGTPKGVTVATVPPGLPVSVTYDGCPYAPTAAGSYHVVATVAALNYTGSASDTFVIGKASASISLGGLSQTYDGNVKSVTATTVPDGLQVNVTYDGGAALPFSAGSHSVQATVDDPNYQGSVSDTLQILDLTPPTGSIAINGNAAFTNSPTVTLTLTCTDLGSGCSQMQFSNDGLSWSSPVCFAPSASWTLSEGDGAKTVQVKLLDAAGNSVVYPGTITLDTAAPELTLSGYPPDQSGQSDASFAFGSPDATALFQCSLDGSAYAACSSPAAYSGLAAGSHSFGVQAFDPAGNLSSPATRSWTIDTTPPDLTITGKPASVTNQSNVSFSFYSADLTALFRCNLDGNGFSACNPSQTFGPLSAGSHTMIVQAVDPAGNASSPAVWSWTIDTTPPDITLTGGPSGPTRQTSATFSFVSGDPTAGFRCSLDGADFAPCASPFSFGALAAGDHTFLVRAIDPAGNLTEVPASRSWSIDLTPPGVQIDSTPAAVTNQTSAFFGFSSTDTGASFQCKLDGAPFIPCASPFPTSGPLAEGSHTFTVQASNAVGNISSAAFSWTIDLTPPPVVIDVAPAAVTRQSTALFAFSSADPNAAFRCSLDGAEPAVCVAPASYAGLSQGSHSFSVRAIDPAGNLSPTPATATWLIDTTAPTLTVTAPTAGQSTDLGNIVVTGNVTDNLSAVTLGISVDGQGYAPTVAGDGSFSQSVALAAGQHVVAVTATDQAGNSSAVNRTVIRRAIPVLIWATPADIVFGTPLSGSQLAASTTVPGTFSYSPVAGTVPGVGSQTLTVNFTPSDTVNYAPAIKSVTVNVLPANFTITASTDGNGSISPAGAVAVAPGGSSTFTLTAGSGYYLSDVLVDGVSVGPVASYTFTNVTVNHTIAMLDAVPDGRIAPGGGEVSIADALIALRIAIGDLVPTADQLRHGDVAPLVNGKPSPNGKIDVGDALVLLRRAVGLVSW